MVVSFEYIDAEIKESKPSHPDDNFNSFDARANLVEFRAKSQEKRITHFYVVAYAICVLIIIAWGILLLTGQTVPDYLIGFIGTIIAFFLLKRPYESN